MILTPIEYKYRKIERHYCKADGSECYFVHTLDNKGKIYCRTLDQAESLIDFEINQERDKKLHKWYHQHVASMKEGFND